jgi:hypothetical protein
MEDSSRGIGTATLTLQSDLLRPLSTRLPKRSLWWVAVKLLVDQHGEDVMAYAASRAGYGS